MTRLLCLLSFCVFASAAIAGPFQYECTVTSLQHDSGTNASDTLRRWKSAKIFVERDTGMILHPEMLATSKDQISRSIVFDKGGQNSDYKAVTITIAGFMAAINVNEFAQGTKKPFAMVQGGKAMTGYCY